MMRLRFDHWLHDIRFGVRILTHAPGLSASAILLIALVIGGNATVYSMVNSILVSPPSGVTREDLVVIRHVDPAARINDPFISFPNFQDYARNATTVTGLTGWNTLRLTLGTSTGNFAIFGGVVTTNYFETFGASVVRGRALSAGDDDAKEGLAVVISHRLWQERFNLSDEIVGSSISINRVPATIVGVAAPGFAGAALVPGEEAWLPIRAYHRLTNSEANLADRSEPAVLIAGRLNPSASISAARAEFATLFAQLQGAYPDARATFSPNGAVTLRNARAVVARYSATALLPIGDMAPIFLAVFSVVTLLTLVVVCANVANLLLGRAVDRQRDTAVRLSLGASRGRIIRMLLAEGATLALLAWIAAYVVAWWTSQAMLRIIEPQPGLLANARPDWTLAAYGLTMAFVATLVFSLAPAFRSWRAPVAPLLKAGEQGIAGGGSRWATALVVVQFAFSVILVTASGLAYRSITTLTSVDLRFDPDNILLVTLRFGDEAGPEGLALRERVRERLTAIPAVEAASYGRRIPGATLLASTRIRRDAEHSTTGFIRPVGPDYFRVIGARVIAGRDLTASERHGGTRAAVINQTLAVDLFGTEPSIGQQLRVGDRDTVEIVGVVTDALFDGPNRDPHPRYVFLAEQQMPGTRPTDPHFFIRYRGSLEAITPLVTRAIREVDASVPVVWMSTMTARLALIFEVENLIVNLLMGFATISLVIAAFGHYAVAMFNMRRRTREFGIRLALGASTGRIQAAVVRESIVHAVAGIVIGLALSAALAIGFKSILFGVTPVDPITYLGVVTLLAVTSVLASYLPALRASRVNVVDALRQE